MTSTMPTHTATRLVEAQARLREALASGRDTQPHRATIASLQSAMQREAVAQASARTSQEYARQQAIAARAAQIAESTRQAALGAA